MMSGDPRRDEVLNAFALEEDPGPATLKSYLARYPEYARELALVAHELERSWPDGAPLTEKQTANVAAAMQRYRSINQATGAYLNPLNLAATKVFSAAAEKLRLPYQVFVAIRQRRVLPDSITPTLMQTLAQALKTQASELAEYLRQPALLKTAHANKAEASPAALGRVEMRQVLIDADVPAERIDELMK